MVGSSSMPYLNSLIATYGLATQYYANTHSSIGNYEMLVTGQVLTNNNAETPASFPITADSIVNELSAAGKTWKAYAENLPMEGYIGGYDGPNYIVNHVPLAYLADVQGNLEVAAADLQTFTSFAVDLAANQLPNFSFVTPYSCDDAQVCTLSTADTWLQTNVPPLLASASFQNDGLLVILFEESANDNTQGGGRVAAVLISPAFSKPGYQSTTLFQHQSSLRLALEGLGVHVLPGAAPTAPAMWEFFNFP
jgi:phosphatidylinositol-3-phosphatase